MPARVVPALLLALLALLLPATRPARAGSVAEIASFSQPGSIATDGHGTVYVSDGGDHTIKKLSSTGAILAVWHRGTAFHSVEPAIAADVAGNVYVLDTPQRVRGVMMGRITKLSPSGAVLTHWLDPQLLNASDLAIDRSGNLFVLIALAVHSGPSTGVLKLNPAGKIVASWAVNKQGYDFATANSVALDPSGNLYVAVRAGSCSPGCQGGDAVLLEKFSNAGKILEGFVFAFDTLSRPAVDGPGLAIDGDGNIYLGGVRAVEQVTPAGVITWIRDAEGCGPGEFRNVGGLAIDGDGMLYVTDRTNGNVQTLSSSGQPLSLWGGCPPPPSPQRAAHGVGAQSSYASSGRSR